MISNPLKIIAWQGDNEQSLTPLQRGRAVTQAHFEKIWHRNPFKFSPLKNCKEKERLKRTLELMESTVSVQGKIIVDLGCGSGELSRRFRDRQAKVTAVDIAKNALEYFRKTDSHNIAIHHDYIPHTSLDDEKFDIAVCTEIIGHLNQKDHRILISELARLIKKEGFILMSTSLDISTEEALPLFIALIETEFEVLNIRKSWHRYFIQVHRFLRLPLKFVKAKEEKNFREEQLSKRTGLKNWWFRVNSGIIVGSFWKGMQPGIQFMLDWFEQNDWLMINLENLCRFFRYESGISHVIVTGRRRPIKT